MWMTAHIWQFYMSRQYRTENSAEGDYMGEIKVNKKSPAIGIKFE